jgi:RNase P subunit RPR2
VPVVVPDADSRWRCGHCGNLTRFDVVRTSRVREFWHLGLDGSPAVEETLTESESLESVTCRWCGAGDRIEIVPRPESDGPLEDSISP